MQGCCFAANTACPRDRKSSLPSQGRWLGNYGSYYHEWISKLLSWPRVLFAVAQLSHLGLGHLIVEVSRSHTGRYARTHTHSLTQSDQLVTEVCIYPTQNKPSSCKLTPQTERRPGSAFIVTKLKLQKTVWVKIRGCRVADNSQKILVGKSQGKRTLERPRSKW